MIETATAKRITPYVAIRVDKNKTKELTIYPVQSIAMKKIGKGIRRGEVIRYYDEDRN